MEFRQLSKNKFHPVKTTGIEINSFYFASGGDPECAPAACSASGASGGPAEALQASCAPHQVFIIPFNPFMPTVPIFAVRETTSLGIMGAPRVPPLNPSETIVF